VNRTRSPTANAGKAELPQYVPRRLAGFELRMAGGRPRVPTGPNLASTQDAQMFRPLFLRMFLENNPFTEHIRMRRGCAVGPVRASSPRNCKRDIKEPEGSMAAAGADGMFHAGISAPIHRVENEYTRARRIHPAYRSARCA